jgi:alkylation response protein AidB-like acyl-CoA dehydrogenase
MDFSLSEDQELLQNTVRRFVAKDCGFALRAITGASAAGWSRDNWAKLADLGLLALLIPEEHGGLGASAVETMLVMEALGPALMLEPYLASAVIATTIIRDAADDNLQARFLPDMANGETIVVPAHDEPGSRAWPERVTSRYRLSGDDYLLSGAKSVVAHAAAADHLIVSARGDGADTDRQGISLFLVPTDATGLMIDSYTLIDGSRAAEVHLRGVRLPQSSLLGVAGQGFDALQRGLDFGLAALCAEAVGVMKACLDATIDHLQARRQFGQPLGRFQALQHRVADMLLWHEQALSMSRLAAARCTSPDPLTKRRALSAAKVTIGRAARFIGQESVQLHGGMGMSDELVVSHWFKRLLSIELAQGDTDTHLQEFINATRSH